MPNKALSSGAEKVSQNPLPEGFARLFATYSSSAAICILDAEHRFLWVNHEFAALNQLNLSQHHGKNVHEVLGSVGEQMKPRLQHVLVTGQPMLNVEISAEHATRKRDVHWRMHFFPIKQESGTSRVGVVVNELTQQQQLEKAVDELDARLHQEKHRFQALANINDLLSSNWDVALLFPRISAYIRRVLRQEMASFVLYDRENDLLVRQSLDFPLSKGLLEQSPVSGKSTPAKVAIERGVPVIFSRKELQDFDSAIARSLVAEGLESLCCVPMLRPRGVIGVLVLGSTRPGTFVPDDLPLLNQVSNQLALAMENHRAASEIEQLKHSLGEHKKYLQGEIDYQEHFSDIVGNSRALREVLEQVVTVASSGANILILGETGTGKELIARAIHRLSQRRDGPLIKVNCAAIPTGLLESELFGHEKGAFTGAIAQKIGRVEMADGGTLFLDEVGEIALELQPKLLRVLQDHEFERLGSNRTTKVGLRLVAATNRNLADRVAQNQFRSDLYYRLSVFPIVVPPLRERKEDIPLLVRYFVRQFSRSMNRNIELIPPETMNALLQWHWPGNVRELENLMERSVILSEGGVLRVPLSELHAQSMPATSQKPNQSLEQAERQHILRVLRETGGKIAGRGGAANRLGLKRTTLQSKMQRLGITRREYTDPTQD